MLTIFSVESGVLKTTHNRNLFPLKYVNYDSVVEADKHSKNRRIWVNQAMWSTDDQYVISSFTDFSIKVFFLLLFLV